MSNYNICDNSVSAWKSIYAESYKIILVGDGGVGKSTYIRRHLTGDFERKYLPTVGVYIRDLHLNTSIGEFTFNMWDCAGQEKFSSMRQGYYGGASAAIIMYDVENSLSFDHVCNWYNEIKSVCGNIPIILCRNKVDELQFDINDNRITLPHYDISVKSEYNCNEPLVHLLKLLTKNDAITIESL